MVENVIERIVERYAKGPRDWRDAARETDQVWRRLRLSIPAPQSTCFTDGATRGVGLGRHGVPRLDESFAAERIASSPVVTCRCGHR